MEPSQAVIAVPEERHRDQIAEVMSTAMNFPLERARLRASLFPLPDMRVALDGDRVLATAAEHRFRQWFGGSAVGCSGIWGVATLPEHRAGGLATAGVDALLRNARERGDPVTALFPAVLAPYRKMGYELAGAFVEHRLPLDALRPLGATSATLALADGARDVGEVREAYRGWIRTQTGPVEPLDEPFWMNRLFERRGDDTFRAVVVRESGRVTGFASFSREADTGALDMVFGLSCHALFTLTTAARDALFRYFRGFRGLGKWLRWAGPPADPTGLTVEDTLVEHPFRYDWMLRLLDVPAAFEARGYPEAEATAVIAVEDPRFPQNAGPWRIEAREGAAKVSAATSARRPIPIGPLSSMFSGYLRPHDAIRLGYLDADDPAAEGLAVMLAGPDPWCPFFF